jgi:hypothetical protein
VCVSVLLCSARACLVLAWCFGADGVLCVVCMVFFVVVACLCSCMYVFLRLR